jgi:hypothetical protein
VLVPVRCVRRSSLIEKQDLTLSMLLSSSLESRLFLLQDGCDEERLIVSSSS